MASAKQKIEKAKPYVERALSDAEVRDHIKSAFVAARDVYEEVLGGRGAPAVATRIASDEDIRRKLKEAVDELRTAADRVQGKAQHTFRNTVLLVTGVAVGLLFNPVTGPTLRRWIKGESSGDGGSAGSNSDGSRGQS
jgi:hypothetical protein